MNIPTIAGIVKQEYGCLIYDIPVTNSKAYEKVRRVLRAVAVPLNLSVYLLPWGLRDKVESLLKEHITNDCDIKFIKYDSASLDDLTKQVEQSLHKVITGIYNRIVDKVQEIRSKSDIQRYDFKYDLSKRLADVETLISIFGITQEIDDLLKATKALFVSNVSNL